MSQRRERATGRVRLLLSSGNRIKRWFSERKDGTGADDTDSDDDMITRDVFVEKDIFDCNPLVSGPSSAELDGQQLLVEAYPNRLEKLFGAPITGVPIGETGPEPLPEMLKRSKSRISASIRFLDEHGSSNTGARGPTSETSRAGISEVFHPGGYLPLSSSPGTDGTRSTLKLYKDPLSERHFVVKRTELNMDRVFEAAERLGPVASKEEKLKALLKGLSAELVIKLRSHTTSTPHQNVMSIFEYGFEIVSRSDCTRATKRRRRDDKKNEFQDDTDQQYADQSTSTDAQQIFLVMKMDYGDHGSLESFLEEFRVEFQNDPNLRVWFATDVLCGLNFIHASGHTTHGDLKASNIMVTNRPHHMEVSEQVLSWPFLQADDIAGAKTNTAIYGDDFWKVHTEAANGRKFAFGECPIIAFKLSNFGVSRAVLQHTDHDQAVYARHVNVDFDVDTEAHKDRLLKLEQSNEVQATVGIMLSLAWGDLSEVPGHPATIGRGAHAGQGHSNGHAGVRVTVDGAGVTTAQCMELFQQEEWRLKLTPLERLIGDYVFDSTHELPVTAKDVLEKIKLFIRTHPEEDCQYNGNQKKIDGSTRLNSDELTELIDPASRELWNGNDVSHIFRYWGLHPEHDTIVTLTEDEVEMTGPTLFGRTSFKPNFVGSKAQLYAILMLLRNFDHNIYYVVGNNGPSSEQAAGTSEGGRPSDDDVSVCFPLAAQLRSMWVQKMKRPASFAFVEELADIEFSTGYLEKIYDKLMESGMKALSKKPNTTLNLLDKRSTSFIVHFDGFERYHATPDMLGLPGDPKNALFMKIPNRSVVVRISAWIGEDDI